MNSYHMLQGTQLGKEMDEKWAAQAVDKRTNIRNYAEDALSNEDSQGLK